MRTPAIAFVASGLLAPLAFGQETPVAPASVPVTEKQEEPDDPRFWSKDDGWFDVSGFLDEKYGFLPIVLPITEPAVGYGAIGALAFFSQPLGAAKDGLGRPSITAVGGMATENGTWGALAADSRYWFDDRLQTVAAVVDASINLDFHGIGKDSRLQNNPLRYNLTPKAGGLIGKYRFGESLVWGGLGYAFASTKVIDGPRRARGMG
jgi:hypothetical protein